MLRGRHTKGALSLSQNHILICRRATERTVKNWLAVEIVLRLADRERIWCFSARLREDLLFFEELSKLAEQQYPLRRSSARLQNCAPRPKCALDDMQARPTVLRKLCV